MKLRPTLCIASTIVLLTAAAGCSTASESGVDGESAVTASSDERSPSSDRQQEEPEGSEDKDSEPPDSPPLVDSKVIPVADSPLLGDPDAPMTIVLFPADNFRTIPRLEKAVEAYPGQVRLVVKHLQGLSLQQGADPKKLRESDGSAHLTDRMALVLEALRRQDPDVYWPATRVLTAARPKFETKPPEEVGAQLAEEHGLDVDQYRAHLDDAATVDAVVRDTKLARGLGITGRSTIVFNGETIGGSRLDLYPIVDMVERHLQALEELRKEGVAPEQLYQTAVDRRVRDDGTLPEADLSPWDRKGWRLPKIRRVAVGGDDPRRGPDDAPVTIVETADLEDCIVCALQHAALQNSLKEYDDQIRVIFKYSPRALQKGEARTARTLAAAQRQGRFWEAYTEVIDYGRQSDPTRRVSPSSLAEKIGLDADRLQSDLTADETTAMIEASADDLRAADVRIVPSLIVNGIELPAPDPRQLEEIVERQIELAGRLRDERGLSGEALHEALVDYNEQHTREVWLGPPEE